MEKRSITALQVTNKDIARVFARIGILSFGGPAAQISLMHHELVERRKWLGERQFMEALSFCMLLPGPEAMQLATYAGWRLRGVIGGLIAGLLFVLPGALIMFGLAHGYAHFGHVPIVQDAFLGIKATVAIIVIQALAKLSSQTLTGWTGPVLALAAFISIFILSIPFPAVIIVAGILGYAFGQSDGSAPAHQNVPFAKTCRTILFWVLLWFAPVAALWFAGQDLLFEISVFFSKLALVTFGGAYAVLSYMTQAFANDFNWLSTPQMIDALGLAETTPGPLILVTAFAAYLTGFFHYGETVAISAMLITLWVTFTPCFLWIFAGAPYMETLLSNPRLRQALNAISASVVGVILNLSAWFALHVLFSEVTPGKFGPAVEFSSFNFIPAALALVAGFILVFARLPMIPAMIAMALASAGIGIYLQ